MFPKNLIIYRVNRDVKFNPDEMEKQLAEFALTPIGSQDKQKLGWVLALPGGELFVHYSGDNILLRSCKQEKLLPASCINKLVQEKVEQLEAQQGRPLKKREKADIKDDIIMDALPTAFIKESFTSLYILPSQGVIVVDASSHGKAEGALALLRKTLGSLPVVPLLPNTPVETTLTQWVKDGTTPSGFSIGSSAAMRSIVEKGAQVTLKHEELSAQSVLKHIEENKVVTSLSMDWQERISFTLKDSMAITRVSFSDDLKDQNGDIPREDKLARLDADFTLISGELTVFITELTSALGGIMDQEDQKNMSEDELVVSVIEFVKQERRASVTAIQRKFWIGYNKASRILERLEGLLVVSKPDREGQRTVLI